MRKNKSKDQVVLFIIENKESFYRLAFSYVKNPEDALDIVQESIEKAISAGKTLQHGQSVKSWFYKIVVNTSIDFLRKNKRIFVSGEEIIEQLSAGHQDTYQDIDLNRSLDELPMKYRSVIILKFFEDLKIDEVAEVLGENKSTIKTRLYKALELLRIQMH
jgi:RNA polymerase sigma-70 factor (ECF subfamily)